MFCFSVLFRIFFTLYIGSSFAISFSFVDISASGIVFFLFFFRTCFRLFSSVLEFFLHHFPRNFSSVIAVMYFEISSSTAQIVLKITFSISISRLQNSSGVSSSDCFAQKMCRGFKIALDIYIQTTHLSKTLFGKNSKPKLFKIFLKLSIKEISIGSLKDDILALILWD